MRKIIAEYTGDPKHEWKLTLVNRGQSSKVNNLSTDDVTLKFLADLLVVGTKDYPKGVKIGTRIEIKLLP